MVATINGNYNVSYDINHSSALTIIIGTKLAAMVDKLMTMMDSSLMMMAEPIIMMKVESFMLNTVMTKKSCMSFKPFHHTKYIQ